VSTDAPWVRPFAARCTDAASSSTQPLPRTPSDPPPSLDVPRGRCGLVLGIRVREHAAASAPGDECTRQAHATGGSTGGSTGGVEPPSPLASPASPPASPLILPFSPRCPNLHPHPSGAPLGLAHVAALACQTDEEAAVEARQIRREVERRLAETRGQVLDVEVEG
jgi:hypothetical protein